MFKQLVPMKIKILFYRINAWYITLLAQQTASVTCPVCLSTKSKILSYGPTSAVSGPSIKYPEISVGHNKYRCLNCSNLFATWLQRYLSEVGEIYSGIDNGESEVYVENSRKEVQKEMMRICSAQIRKLYRNRPVLRILDFGCGPNYKAAVEMNEEDNRLDCYSCDINPALPYNGTNFFKYPDTVPEEMRGSFDGICSVDVFEHLNLPLEDMRGFNRLLKNGGIMVHFTPLQWYFRIHHGGHDATAFHTNFPSRKSLKILCDKTGFKFIGDYMPKYGYWYLVFIKSFDS